MQIFFRFVGVLSRGENILSLPLQPRDGDLIRVLVENQGIRPL